MTAPALLTAVAGATLLALLTAIFALYQNPLLEIYLADWGLC